MRFRELVIASGLKVTGSGVGKALCPFHREKTPSFTIYPNGGKCFGCGWSGDAIGWLMDYEHLDFKEASAKAQAMGMGRKSTNRPSNSNQSSGTRESLPHSDNSGRERDDAPSSVEMKPKPRKPFWKNRIAARINHASSRPGAGSLCRSNLIERGLWRDDIAFPSQCRRVDPSKVTELGIPVPDGTKELLAYLFLTESRSKAIAGVMLEAIGECPEDQTDDYRLNDPMIWPDTGLPMREIRPEVEEGHRLDATFTIEGRSNLVVLCDTTLSALACHTLYPGATTIATLDGMPPERTFRANVTKLAEGSPKWAEALGDPTWKWVVREPRGGGPADDLQYIAGREGARQAAMRIEACGDYCQLTATSVFRQFDNWAA